MFCGGHAAIMAGTPPCPVEFRKEAPPVALRTHHERCSFEFINHRTTVCDLTELNAMPPEWVFEFGQAKLHLQDGWPESLTELIGLFR